MRVEVWKSVKGYEGLYEVSTFGRVKALSRTYTDKNGRVSTIKERIMKQSIGNAGYWQTALRRNGVSSTTNIHRTLAETFVPNPDKKPFVNHIDGNKTNNEISNLEWVTHEENIKHAAKNGLMKKGESHHGSKLDGDKVRFIRSNVTTNGGKMSYRELGAMFGVSRHVLQCAVYRRTWTHVK